MSVPRLVIFDCDGVLVDSESISNNVLARMLSDQGLPTTLAEARRDYQGLLLGDVLERAEAKLGRSLPTGWLADYERTRGDVFTRELQPVRFAADTVKVVKHAGVQVCVASQGKLAKTRHSLDLTGLRDLFLERALFSAEAVAHGKPHPDLFLHAAYAMQVTPSACVVVEDTPSGVATAGAAKMRVLGYAADSDEAALRHAGAEIFHSLDQLPGLLGLDARADSA